MSKFLLLLILSVLSTSSDATASTRSISSSLSFGVRNRQDCYQNNDDNVSKLLFQLRGGKSTPGGIYLRPPSKVDVKDPFNKSNDKQSSSTRFRTNDQQHQQEQLSDSNEKEETKEIIDTFLTRDSRNSFIGTIFFFIIGVKYKNIECAGDDEKSVVALPSFLFLFSSNINYH
mmetsp:Transcript_36438/g.36823  ORF Transcript_36438/g.36823 Transcript_36438/m.36823 type:complete len:173 (+) Transcript_36438:95-613(+)